MHSLFNESLTLLPFDCACYMYLLWIKIWKYAEIRNLYNLLYHNTVIRIYTYYRRHWTQAYSIKYFNIDFRGKYFFILLKCVFNYTKVWIFRKKNLNPYLYTRVYDFVLFAQVGSFAFYFVFCFLIIIFPLLCNDIYFTKI